jgi:Cu/Ag efflux pump CusA
VANVVEDHQPLIGDAVLDEDPNLLLVIEKLPGTNTLEVTRGLDDALDALRPGFASIDFDATLFRPATFLETAMANLGRTLVISAFFVVLLLFAFFWRWRTALVSLVAIPVSLMAALIVLHLRGATLNTMVLAGLVVALGIVIDEAIVDVDRFVRRLRQNQSEDNPKSIETVILDAATETRGAMFFAMLIVLLAVVPVFFMEGVSGALFQPLAVSYTLAVLAAMVVALTVTPALSSILFAMAPLKDRESPLIPWLQRGYDWILARTAQRAWLAIAVAALLIVASLALLPLMRQDRLLPSFEEPYLTVQLDAAPGTSLPAMQQIVTQASSDLGAIPGVSNVAAHMGRAVFGDRVVNINSAELWVTVDPKADYDATVAAVHQAANRYAELSPRVQTPTQQILDQAETEASHAATVRVFGEDHEVLREEAERIRRALAGIGGVVDPQVLLPLEEPTVEIEVDLASAQRHGVKPGDVRRSASTLLSGINVGSLFEEQKVFDVVVWGAPEIRDTQEDIGELLVDTPRGGHVRLKEVADVRLASSPAVIKREAVSPYLDIGFDIEGRSTRAVLDDVQAAIRWSPFPLEYHAVVLAGSAQRQATQRTILFAGLMVLFGAFLLLQASFRSWRLAFVVLLTLPAALAGSIWAALLGGSGSLVIGLLAGLLAVLGVAVRNTIIQVSNYHHLEEQEGEDFGLDLILSGARQRLVPVLMTALALGLALLPFLLLGNIPGHEVARPVVIAILGGLVTSAFYSLFILPALYLRFGAVREADLGLAPVPASSEA